jgi:hypothetical protein
MVPGQQGNKKMAVAGGPKMKIDLTDKVQQLSKQTVHNPRKNQRSNGFDSVLQDSIQKSNPPSGSLGHSVQRLMGPLTFAGVEPNSKNEEYTAVQKLLDKLESYQQMLADPAATLKMIHPCVEKMEQKAASAEVLLNRMPDDHPLKMILEEVIQNISKEVEKFNTGYYVDA